MGARSARALLWVLASVLALFAMLLAWAVSIAGGGWYLLLAAGCFLLPLPLWYFLTDRRRGKNMNAKHGGSVACSTVVTQEGS